MTTIGTLECRSQKSSCDDAKRKTWDQWHNNNTITYLQIKATVYVLVSAILQWKEKNPSYLSDRTGNLRSSLSQPETRIIFGRANTNYNFSAAS